MEVKANAQRPEVTEAEIRAALKKAVTTGKFDRSVFPANSWLGALGVGSRKPQTPRKREKLWQQAYRMAQELDGKLELNANVVTLIGPGIAREVRRNAELAPAVARRRDRELLTALRQIHQATAEPIFSINGRKYVLLDMGEHTCTYVDVSPGSEYSLNRPAKSGFHHVVARDGTDLGPIVEQKTDLKHWLLREPDGTSIPDSRFPEKIQRLRNWRSAPYSHEDAYQDLLTTLPGTYRLYAGDRNDHYVIAYQSENRGVLIEPFSGKTGEMESFGNVLALIRTLDSLRQENPGKTYNSIVLNPQQKQAYIKAFGKALTELFIGWQETLTQAHLRAVDKKDVSIVRRMLDTVNCNHPSDLYRLLQIVADKKPDDSEYVAHLRDIAANMIKERRGLLLQPTPNAPAEGPRPIPEAPAENSQSEPQRQRGLKSPKPLSWADAFGDMEQRQRNRRN